MDDRDRCPPARGDEAELFRLYNDELMRTVSHAVGYSTPQIVEDACSFAWAKFLQVQPDRDKNWRGWLFRTAQREVWVLEGRLRDHWPLGEAGEEERMLAASTLGRPDPYEIRLAVNEAFEILEHLPERLQRIALLRALGMRHKDISELTGDSPVRVGQLIVRANDHIYGVLDERAHQQRQLPQRAQRLEQLERRPPSWLTERIGRPPSRGRRNISQSATRRAWRRAALALDDFRAAGGFGEVSRDQPDKLQQLRELADTAVADLKRVRQIGRGCER
jgi:DNA-directed RNA polymerase specialized sigma24 family protein